MTRDTQRKAWEELQPTIGAKRQAVLTVIRRRKGAALFEIADHLGWPINRVSGRVTELTKLNLVRDSGRRVVNPASGKNVIVWIEVTADDDGQMVFL